MGIELQRRERKRWFWLAGLGLCISLALIIWLSLGFRRAAQEGAIQTRKFADEAFSYALVRDKMGEYYAAHGRYPSLLRELTNSTTLHRPEQDFKADVFEYEEGGNIFTLRWNNSRLPQVPCLLEGRDGVIIRDDFSH